MNISICSLYDQSSQLCSAIWFLVISLSTLHLQAKKLMPNSVECIIRPQICWLLFLIDRPRGFSAIEFITIIFICTYQTSDRRHEHSDERNANKCVCLVHSIQKNPSTMADNERRSSCHHACQLLSWEISVGWIMIIPARPHCVQEKHLMRNWIGALPCLLGEPFSYRSCIHEET